MNNFTRVLAIFAIYQAVLLVPGVLSTQVTVSFSKVEKSLRGRSDLCKNQGTGFVYDNGTKSCHMIGTRGPCADLMKFVQNGSNPDYGHCVCDFRKQCGRPVVYWPADGKCYFVYDKGPCGDKEWITLDGNRTAICSANVCVDEQLQTPSNGSKFWFSENGTCYQTRTRGYCESPDALLFFRSKDTKPSCNLGALCARANGSYLRNLIVQLRVHPKERALNGTGSGGKEILRDDDIYTNSTVGLSN